MNISEKKLLVGQITTKANQLASLAIGLMTIGYDCQHPEKSILNEAEIDHISAIKTLGHLVQQVQDDIKDLSEKLILAL